MMIELVILMLIATWVQVIFIRASRCTILYWSARKTIWVSLMMGFIFVLIAILASIIVDMVLLRG